MQYFSIIQTLEILIKFDIFVIFIKFLLLYDTLRIV